jgi:hypothetical protein
MQRQLILAGLSLGLLVGIGFVMTARSTDQKLAAVAQAATNAGARADQFGGRRCRLRNLEGSYGIFANGTVVTAPAGVPTGPFATVGKMDVEDDGSATVVLTRSFNGIITRETLPGTLTINDDCTGTATFGGVRTFDIISVDGGNELQFIQTNPGSVVTVIAKRR